MTHLLLEKIEEMWGTTDARVGILIKEEEIWFSYSVKTDSNFLCGEFTKR